MAIVVYADFNCPFSALTSHRLDRLGLEVDFRAVEHEPDLPPDGRAMVGDAADEKRQVLTKVHGLVVDADGDVSIELPEVLPNTATLCRAYASQPTAELRQRLFAAIWAEGDAVAVEETDDGRRRQEEWQSGFGALDEQVVPTLIDADGTVHSGVAALEDLATRYGA